ncbi:MAG: type VI secretion system tip protein TssI/VgrG [Polyangiaceae bacterium]
MRERWVRLQSPAFDGLEPDVVAMRGRESLGELFSLTVELVADDADRLDERAGRLLDERMTVDLVDQGEVVRRVHGIVSDVTFRHEVDDHRGRMSLTVVPRLWQLTQKHGAELFLNLTVPDVIEQKLQAIGLRKGVDYRLSLEQRYPVRELIVQYEETDAAFLFRLCEHEGITLFFQHDDERDVVVLTDDNAAFAPISRPAPVPVRAKRDHPAAYDVTTQLARRPQATQVHDYNYRSPRLRLDAGARIDRPSVTQSWVEYGAHTKFPEETTRLAKVRAEELAATHEVVRGRTTELAFTAGGVAELDHVLFGTMRLLLVAVTHHGEDYEWDASFEAISATTSYRPPRRTPRPKISGLVNARVDGEIRGHYAELDAMGRYHVQIGFDRSGRTDLKASHPVRMMQPHAGSRYGMHFPLQPGTEVLLGFVDGNPDRPIIVGTSPNPETASPVDADNFSQNVLRTKSNNELVIEDELGNERIRLHTPHQTTTIQLGSIEEAELGALTTTEAHISQAARGSHNVAADAQTTLTRAATTLVGNNAVTLAGLEGLVTSAQRGLQQPSGVATARILRDFSTLSLSPEDLRDHENEVPDEAESDAAEGGASGLWSSVASALASSAEASAFDAVRTLAFSADRTLDEAIGRRQGERLGAPLGPAAIQGAPQTAALFGRSTAFVFGDRVAVLGSDDTAAVVGRDAAELKSPGMIEVAGGREVAITSAGELSAEANTMRLVGGYYPEAEAPPLDDGTSVGVMSRRDLRVTSVEDCILICAQKNLIASAHEGDIRLTAKNTVQVSCATHSISAGEIVAESENTTFKVNDTFEVEAQRVIIKAPSILLDGSVQVTGNLDVYGKLDVRDDTKLASG